MTTTPSTPSTPTPQPRPTRDTQAPRTTPTTEQDQPMTTLNRAEQVAVVGSPSSNVEITLDLLDSAIHEPLVGSMLCLAQPLSGGLELGLGMVTEVTTENQWHNNPALRGVVKTRGNIPGMSGDTGDIRAATIKLQAAYKNDTLDGEGDWRQSGPSLRMSPPTGTAIRRVTDDLLDALVAGEDDIHYLGHMHGSQVKVPMQIRDFSGSRGAFMSGYFGVTGSGKSAMACYGLAGQMRHKNQGLIIIDPQGQWSHEQDLPFSLQGFATELGRDVVVRRISEDLRLEKDAPLFGELLGKTRFIREIMKMSTETSEILIEELVKVLKSIDNWPDLNSAALLEELMRRLRAPNVLRRIYADNSKKIRLMVAFSEILGQPCEETIDGELIADLNPADARDYVLDANIETRQKDALAQFAPLHNLFAETNPGGGTRHSLWGTVSAVFDTATRGANPAPMLVLDMSTSGGVSWLQNILADDEAAEAMESIRIIDQDSIKAAILAQICRTLKNASESAFRNGENLNTNVVFDEAWRFAPPPHLASDDEVKALSILLAGLARDTRKFGIGWTYITQTTRSINQDIWDQMTVRVLGYGLAGADIEKVAEQVDDRDHLKLYRSFAPPDSTNPKVYPFMLTGPVSPLSFSKAPILLAAFLEFQSFRDCNHAWIEQIRLSMGKPVLSGTPVRADGSSTMKVRKKAVTSTVSPRGAVAQRQIEAVRAHRVTGGVNPSVLTGLSSDTSFSSGLDALDDDPPPF